MDEELCSIPIYLLMGFLESGKTSFINEILQSGEFADGDKGIIISCEEGEEEINSQAAVLCNLRQVSIEDESELTAEFLKELDQKYHPQRVFIEYNGMWDPDTIFSVDLPDEWGIYQIVTMIDGSTFGMYLQNGDMKSLIGNIIKCSELVIINRCDETQDLPMYRRQVRAINNRIQMMFEHKDGNMIELGKDVPPYDLNAPVIEINDEDFGLFYMDAADDRERYDGKTVHFKGKAMLNRKFSRGYFVPGRNAMTCCEADIRFIGFLCKCEHIDQIRNGQWLDVTAKIRYENRKEYFGLGPVLYTIHITNADKPKEDLVYFN